MEQVDEPNRRYPWARLLAAISAMLAFILGVYFLVAAVRPAGGLVSFSFLLVLPAAICACIAYVADPWATRTLRQYLLIPVWLVLGAVIVGGIILREGVICILLLSPLWLLAGCLGTYLTYKMRRRIDHGRTYCMTAIALPVFAMVVEPSIPLPTTQYSVARSAIVDASPDRLWPLLRGIPDVRPTEGAWNVTQDVIGVPRPVGAHLTGEGIGATRRAVWTGKIRFDERIAVWQPGYRIGWTFEFNDIDAWAMTDRHLMPNSPYFQVTHGGYLVEPLSGGRSRLTLTTSYRVTTPVNAYARLWGELFLGDLENNLLALIDQRAASNARRPA